MTFAQINPAADQTLGAWVAAYDAGAANCRQAQFFGSGPNIDFHLEYPMIEVMGGSFATTIRVGVFRARLPIRPEMPLSLDGDASIIHGIFNTCGLGHA